MAGTTMLTRRLDSGCLCSSFRTPVLTANVPTPMSRNSTMTCWAQISANSIKNPPFNPDNQKHYEEYNTGIP